jgi:TRAP-type C4-dicarboxylate transport system permease small subunit
MAMLGQELTQRYNKFTEKVIEFVTVATALAMMAFAAWQLWMQYFITQGGGK